MSATLHFDILDPAFKSKLAVLPEKMLDHAEEALSSQVDLIVALAKVYVPVEYGALRDSIRKERGGKGLHWRQYSIRAGGYVTHPKTGKLVNYAKYQEMGTKYMRAQPFIQPAVDEVQPTIADMIKHKVVLGVQT